MEDAIVWFLFILAAVLFAPAVVLVYDRVQKLRGAIPQAGI